MSKVLTFIVLACHFNVSVPDENSPSCRTFKEEINSDFNDGLPVMSPMACMSASLPKIEEFQRQHPGWQARRWTCKYIDPYENT